MATGSIRLQGTLTDPMNNMPDEGAKLRFTMLSNLGTTLNTAVSELEIDATGEYDITLAYGEVKVEYKTGFDVADYVTLSTVTISEDTVAETIPQLVLSSTVPTDENIQTFQLLLSRANTAASAAEASETASAASESSASTSATNAAASASTATSAANTATTAKDTAVIAASTASTKATEAASSAVVADSKSVTATTQANNASASATAAANSASAASTSADEANVSANAADTANTQSNTAKVAAENAATSATASATSATASKNAAASSATDAASSATSASSSAGTATSKATSATASATSASSSASTASTKASEASSSATAAANSATASAASATTAGTKADEAAVSAAASQAIFEDFSVLNAAMSQVEFEARVAENKRKYAGSGFIEWGKHYPSDSYSNQIVNQGLWEFASTNATNELQWGTASDRYGTSDSNTPVALVNGCVHYLDKIKYSGDTNRPNSILFPEAEQGTRSYDSGTGVVIDYLTDIDPKYGDVAEDLNEAVARNFEGLVPNGDFRDGLNDWAPSLVTVADHGYYVANGGYLVSRYSPEIPVEAGGEYELSITSAGECIVEVSWTGAGVASFFNTGVTYSDKIETNVYTVIVPTDDEYQDGDLRIICRGRNGAVTTQYVHIGFRKISNQPILSRQDFSFLETWHEKISDKDLFVPLGNVQHGNTAIDEGLERTSITALGTDQGYCAFGEWDTDTVGYGVRWSTMTDAQKVACLSNPKNNIYYDAEAGELIQVRYRVRVAKGMGDDWGKYCAGSLGASPSNSFLNYDNKNRPRVQGSLSESGYTPGTVCFGNIKLEPVDATMDLIVWGARANSSNAAAAYNGICFALPICLVQRGNQGAYHPVWNVSGHAKWTIHSDTTKPWYGTFSDGLLGGRATPLSAFLRGKSSGDIGGYQGAISTGISGRQDQYKYYDVVYAGQVQDLRLNANKQDPAMLLQTAVRSAVKGTTRGMAQLPFSTVYDDAGSGDNDNAARLWYPNGSNMQFALYTDPASSGVVVGDYCIVYDATEGVVVRFLVDAVTTSTIVAFAYDTSTTFEVLMGGISNWQTGTGNEVYYIIEKKLSPVYDSLPWVDIIGSPANIMATFPNGVVGQWVPSIPDGSGIAMPANKKVSGVPTRTYSMNNGSTWVGNAAVTTDATNNTFTDGVPSTFVGFIVYAAHADFTESAVNAGVKGVIGNVVTCRDNRVNQGNRLMPSLIGEIGATANWSDYKEYPLLSSQTLLEYASQLNASSGVNTHPELIMRAIGDCSGVKVLPHLIEADGLLYLQHHATELVYGADWGDDGGISIASGETTKTDLNGNNVKIVTHNEVFPVGIAAAIK